MNRFDEEHAIRIRAARLWLSEGYTTAEKVRELHRAVAATRGTAYADALREEMRTQWRRRREWMTPAADLQTGVVE